MVSTERRGVERPTSATVPPSGRTGLLASEGGCAQPPCRQAGAGSGWGRRPLSSLPRPHGPHIAEIAADPPLNVVISKEVMENSSETTAVFEAQYGEQLAS